MLVSCPSCSAKFNVPDAKIAGKRARMKCKKCGETIQMDGTHLTVAPPQPAPALSVPNKKKRTRSAPRRPPTSSGISTRWRVSEPSGKEHEMSLADVARTYSQGGFEPGTLVCAPGKDDWLPPYDHPQVMDMALPTDELASPRPPQPTFSENTVTLGVEESAKLTQAAARENAAAQAGAGVNNSFFAHDDVDHAMDAFDSIVSLAPGNAPRNAPNSPVQLKNVPGARGSVPAPRASVPQPRSSSTPSPARGQRRSVPPPSSRRPSVPAPSRSQSAPPSAGRSGARSTLPPSVSQSQASVSSPRPPTPVRTSRPVAPPPSRRPAPGPPSSSQRPPSSSTAPAYSANASVGSSYPPAASYRPAPSNAPAASAAVSFAPPAPSVPPPYSRPPSSAAPSSAAPSSAPPYSASAYPGAAQTSTPTAPSFAPAISGPAPTAAPPVPSSPSNAYQSAALSEPTFGTITAPPSRRRSSPGLLPLFLAIVLVLGALAGIYLFRPALFQRGMHRIQALFGMETAADPPPKAEGPPFDAQAAGEVLGQIAAEASKCREPGGPVGKGRAQVLYTTDGSASSVAVSRPFHETSVGSCLQELFKKTRVPAFGGDPVVVSKTFDVQ